MTINLTKSIGIAGALAAAFLVAPAASGPARSDVEQSAYCIGALKHSQAALARFGAPVDAQMQQDALARSAAILRTSVGRDGLDVVAVRDLMAAGRTDALACWDQVERCFYRGTADQACTEPVATQCSRASACNR